MPKWGQRKMPSCVQRPSLLLLLSSQSQVWEASVGLHTAPRREQIGDSWSQMTSCRLRLLKLQLFFKTDGVKRLPHLDCLRGKLCSALETDFQKCSHSTQCPLKQTKLSCFQDGREGSDSTGFCLWAQAEAQDGEGESVLIHHIE